MQQKDVAENAVTKAESDAAIALGMLKDHEGFAGDDDAFKADVEGRLTTAIDSGCYVEKQPDIIAIPNGVVDMCDADSARADLIAALMALDRDAESDAFNLNGFAMHLLMDGCVDEMTT